MTNDAKDFDPRDPDPSGSDPPGPDPRGADRPPADATVPGGSGFGSEIAAAQGGPGQDAEPLDAPTPTFEAEDLEARAVGRSAATPPMPRRGASLGRYVVLDQLGAGGLGVVFSAYDPSLDRRIAVKLLRRRGDAALQSRLQREAQALARLNHRNVVTVFDVGRVEGQVFLAMEHVEGVHLGRWLKNGQRPQREVLDVFLQAGRGLAHAHDEGVVHRDFKPSNVMVSGGRAVVLDFGLARSLEEVEEGAEVPDASEVLDAERLMLGGGPNVEIHLTPAGSVLGTPSFMAPEQWRGESATVAADQFSFCVSLFLALNGRPPFVMPKDGTQSPEWRLSTREGDVTGRLAKILEKGLAEKAEDRHGSMRELLAQLESVAGRRRRIAQGLLVGALVIGVGAGTWLLRPSPAEVCEAGPGRLAEVWGAPERLGVERAFRDTQRPYAEDVARATTAALEAYGESWRLMYRDACEATHRRGEQSAELLDRRMICLEQRRRELGSLVELFQDRPNETVEQAVRSAFALSAIEACGDGAGLAAQVSLPQQPEIRGQVEEVRGRLAEAKALQEAGEFAGALEIAEEARRESGPLDYLPLRAEATARVGEIHGRLNDSERGVELLRRASAMAQAAGDDRVAAEAFIRLVRAYGYQLGSLDEGELYADLAASLLDRLGASEDLSALLADQRGLLARLGGDYAAAEQAHRRALEIERSRPGASPARVATSLLRLAGAQKSLGEHDEARTSYGEALDIQRANLGDRHPDVAVSLQGLGTLAFELGEIDRAEALYQEALDIFLAVYGEDHSKTAIARLHLGGVFAARGLTERSLTSYRSARRAFERLHGPDHPHVAIAWSNIGSTHWDAGDLPAAVSAFEAALRVQGKVAGDSHPSTANIRVNLCAALNGLGRHREAERQARSALEVLATTFPDGHESVASALHELGLALEGRGDPEGAIESLEDAWALWDHVAANPRFRAETAWSLALLLEARDSPRARELAREALEIFTRQAAEDRVGDIETWLEGVP